MPLPYENATSGAGALDEIRKVLTRFGCSRFASAALNGCGARWREPRKPNVDLT